MSKQQKITPYLWFDANAEEAAKYYTALFADSHIDNLMYYGEENQEITGKSPGSVMLVNFHLAGFRFVGLNGGSQFTFTPAISFFVICENEAEIDALWAGFSANGVALMELGKYDWSEKYGWVQDQFGLTWQLMLGKIADVGQKITPALMFVDQKHGRAEEAINLYTETFADSKIDGLLRYAEGQSVGAVQHAQFALNDEKFMAMDGGLDHSFDFNEAISLQIACATQAEVDHFWAKLTANGGEEGACGWLKDKFGVSWQVTPTEMYDLFNNPDPAISQSVARAMFQMKKLDIEVLKRAAYREATG
jgi:predicted 3-demethylubiquinone-9 3-methyltransferase (glyoxalase superfamily)